MQSMLLRMPPDRSLSNCTSLNPLLSIPVAEGYIESVGEDYLSSLMSVLRRSSSAELENTELLKKRLREELKKYKS